MSRLDTVSDGTLNSAPATVRLIVTPVSDAPILVVTEAAKSVEVTGMSVARAAKQLSMPKSSLDNWVRV